MFVIKVLVILLLATSVCSKPILSSVLKSEKPVDPETLFNNYLLTYEPLQDNTKKQTNWHRFKTESFVMPVDISFLLPEKATTLTVSSMDSGSMELVDQSPKYIRPSLFVSQNADRRFMFMFSPFKRLMMAYLAPRILRFQFSMLVNSLIGELGRKILEPIIAMRSQTNQQSQPPPTLSTLEQLQQLTSALSPKLGSSTNLEQIENLFGLNQSTLKPTNTGDNKNLTSVNVGQLLQTLGDDRAIQQLISLMESGSTNSQDKILSTMSPTTTGSTTAATIF